MWKLYDALLDGLPEDPIRSVQPSPAWTLAQVGDRLGLAMTTEGSTREPLFPAGLAGLPVRQAAAAVKSWNFPEAVGAMAAINACLNTEARMEALGCRVPYERYCTDGLDLRDKTVGLVGHLKMPPDTLAGTRAVYILEKHPRPGDYPDSACEDLLPRCDVVLITGSALINKTLPRLLELSRNAVTILTGPTVPLCPALLDLGLDRLAGMAVTDPDGMRMQVARQQAGPPYAHGATFLLTGDRP